MSKTFLKISKIEGASKDADHLHWIDAYSWRWGTESASFRSKSKGKSANDSGTIYVVVPPWDGISELLRAENSGRHFDAAVLQSTGDDGRSVTFVMSNVLVVNVRYLNQAGSELLHEIELFYQSMKPLKIPISSAAAMRMGATG